MENIEFYYPQFLLMFVVPLSWLMYLFLTKKHKSQAIFSEEVLKKIINPSGGLSIKTRTIFTFVALLFMIVALARPVIPDGEIEIESKKVDVVVALDISRSMLAKDYYPNRLEFAKQKILTLVKESQNNRIGVIAFANGSYIVSPLTFDKDAVGYLVHNLNTLNITEQGTSFLSLLSSAKEFLKEHNEKVLIVFTDGGDKEDYSEEIELALKENIQFFIVGIGTEEGAPIEMENGTFLKHNGSIVISKINEAIKTLALGTDGAFIKSANSLEDVRMILGEIEAMKSNESKKQSIPIFIELFYYPLGVAILFLLPIFFSLPRFRKTTHRIVSKNRINSFILFASFMFLTFGNTKLEAGFFDFFKIDDAKESYQNQDFKTSQDIYKELARTNNSDEVKYNLANSYYKNENYSKASKLFKEITESETSSDKLKYSAFHNLGNSQIGLNQLEEAIKSYEKALKIQDSEATKENLEWVKEQIQKQQQENQDQNQNGNNNQENDQNSEEKQQEKNQDQNSQNKDNQDSSENKNSDNQNQERDDKVDPKNKNSDDSKNDKQGESDSKEQSNEPAKPNENPDKKDESQEQKTKFSKVKEEQLSEEDLEQNLTLVEAQNENISDREEQKLLELIQNLDANTKIYTIVPPKKEEDPNVKPW